MGRKKRKAAAQCAAEDKQEEFNMQAVEAAADERIASAIKEKIPGITNAAVRLVLAELMEETPESCEDTFVRISIILQSTGNVKGSGDELAIKVYEAMDELIAEDANGTDCDEHIYVTKSKKARESKPPKQKTQQKAGVRAGEERPSETLGVAISKLKRHPKPRSKLEIDELIWSGAQQTAMDQLSKEYNEKRSWEEYYLKMCKVGQSLLAGEIQRRTQLIYDYRASRVFSKQQKKTHWISGNELKEMRGL